jgi:hypothetical protein
MEKTLRQEWFLEEPIDSEYKEYILLDFLKSKNEKIEISPYSVLKEASVLVRSLNSYKDKGINQELLKKQGISKDLGKIRTEMEVIKIIDESLNTLYRYSELCLDIIKTEEEKIKIFRIESESTIIKAKDQNSGIVIVRNMITDQIIPYLFYSQVKMKTQDGEREIFIMRKAPIKNMRFSLKYIHIYHEILDEYKIKSEVYSSLYAIEISDDFKENSEILKISKEKFLNYIADLKY